MIDGENLSWASSLLYVWGDGSLFLTGFFFSSSLVLGFMILVASVLFLILSKSIGFKCDGVSIPLNAASSVYPPPVDFWV